MNMNTLTLADALRHTIGFDPFTQFAADAARQSNFPPYNIERTSEDTYRVTLAVAGFTRDEITISIRDRMLHVTGNRKAMEAPGQEFLHRGIAMRDFTRQFALGEHVEVTGADLEHGLLVLDLERRLPEAAKPKVIAINAKPPAGAKAKKKHERRQGRLVPPLPYQFNWTVKSVLRYSCRYELHSIRYTRSRQAGRTEAMASRPAQ